MAELLIDIRVDGVRKLLRKLQDDPVHARPWTAALNTAVRIAFDETRRRAPKLTGALTASITHSTQKRPVPLWGKVTFPNRVKKGGKRGKGFRYGGALEGGSRYHYRSTPFAGKPTRGWFSGSLDRVQEQINDLLSSAAREIQSAWGE